MSIKKRLAAVACAVIMAASLVSCGEDTMHICETENYKVNAGVYIYYVMSSLNNQMYSIYYSTGKIPDDIVNTKYDDGTLTVGEYSEQYAYGLCEEMAAIAEKFDAMGLELTDEDYKLIKDNVESAWNEDYYESLGIAKSSLEQIQMFGQMNDKVFGAYYFEGGLQEVSDEDINKYLSENYIRFKMISITKDKDDNGKAAKEKAEKYLALTEEMDFDKVIEQFEADKEAEKNDDDKNNDSSKDDSSSNDESSATDDNSAVDSSSAVDDSSANDSSSSTDDGTSSASEVTPEADESSKSDSSEDGSSDADKDDEEEKDNNIIINKTSSNYKDLDVVKHVDTKMENDDIEIFEDDDSWYVLQKLDVTGHKTYVEDNREGIISEMKTEDFEKMIDSWVEEYKITKNDKAYKRYTAEEIFEDYNDYMEKNSKG